MNRRAGLALLLVAALSLGGCGGDDDPGQPRAGDGQSSERTTVSPPGTGGAKPGKDSREDERREDDGSGGSQDPSSRLSPEALERAASTVAGFNGLRNVSVDVSSDLRTVTISLKQADACAAKPGVDRRVASLIQQQLKVVRRVVFAVGGRSFAAARSSCRAPTLPGGSGKVVYASQGAGVTETPEFSIASKHWTVAYRGGGGYFSVFVFKGRKLQAPVIASRDRSVDSMPFKGPGRFKLKVVGQKPWVVTVRDGA